MKKLGNAIRSHAIFIVFILFLVIQGICLIQSGDDLMWLIFGMSDVFGSDSPNGRYFTNLITLAIEKCAAARVIVYPLVMFTLMVLNARLIAKEKPKQVHYFFSIISIFLSPVNIVQQTTMWISGFTNYVISAVLCLIYLLYCKPIFSRNSLPTKKAAAIPLLLLGFLTALCLETTTIYIVLFDLFVLIFSLAVCRKIHIANLSHCIGTVIGTVVMFTNHNYHGILQNQDAKGMRSFEFNFSDIYAKLYTKLLANVAKPYYLFQILICISIIYLLLKHPEKYEAAKNKRYWILSLLIVTLFPCYSTFTNLVSNFAIYTNQFRMQAIELCITFLYFIGLAYLSFALFERAAAIRSALFLCSIVISVAPFLIVEPITQRCFFTNYAFWALLCGNAFSAAFGERNETSLSRLILILPTAAFTLLFSIVNISNKYTEILRIRYIKEQLSSHSNRIEIIALPYPKYADDSILTILKSGNENAENNSKFTLISGKITSKSYIPPLLSYLGVSNELTEKQLVEINLTDYFLAAK